MESKTEVIAINGVVTEVHELLTGDNWKKQSFVVLMNDKYERYLCINVFNDKVEQLSRVKVNDHVKVNINVSSKIYNEKWYTEVTAWKIEIDFEATQKQTQKTPQI